MKELNRKLIIFEQVFRSHCPRFAARDCSWTSPSRTRSGNRIQLGDRKNVDKAEKGPGCQPCQRSATEAGGVGVEKAPGLDGLCAAPLCAGAF
jgi:hypothetical protein